MAQHVAVPAGRETEIDEARPGDFRGGEQGAEFRIRLHDGHELLGDLAGSLMKNLGGLQSDRTGNIAVFGEFRALQRNGKGTCADSGKGTGEEANQGLFLLIEHFCRKTDCSK